VSKEEWEKFIQVVHSEKGQHLGDKWLKALLHSLTWSDTGLESLPDTSSQGELKAYRTEHAGMDPGENNTSHDQSPVIEGVTPAGGASGVGPEAVILT